MSGSTIAIIVVVFLVLAIGGPVLEWAKSAGERRAKRTGQDPAQIVQRYEGRAAIAIVAVAALAGLIMYANGEEPATPNTSSAGAPATAAVTSGNTAPPPVAETKPASEPRDQSRRIAYKVIGCQNYETYDRRMTQAAQGDKEAFAQSSAEALATGECVWLQEGEKIYIDEWGFASKKVRRAGKQTAYWVPTEAVREAGAKEAEPGAEAKPIAEEKPAPETKKAADTKGSIFRMTAQSFGCKDPQFLERLVTYASDGDDKAFLELAAVSVAAGECIRMKKGHQVFIEEDRDIIKKVRPKGEHLFYWVMGGQVKAEDSTQKPRK